MNPSIHIFIQLIPMAAIFTLLLQKNHILIILLSLEGLMLRIVIFIPLLLATSGVIINYLRVLILTFGACEASIGLSLIVIIARTYGSDILKATTTNKC